MSNVSNVHQFAALEKNSKPLSGQRLIRLIAKKDKNDQYASANLTGSLCVSVPQVDQNEVADAIVSLMPHIVGLIADTQDKIVREWRIEHGRNEIPGEVFSVAECVKWLDANAAGDRVSAEYLAEWFQSEYREIALTWINTAIHGAAEEVIEKKYNVLRDMFTGFSSSKYSPSVPVCKAIAKFGEYLSASECEVDSRMAGYIAKAAEIQEKKEKELSIDALGF